MTRAALLGGLAILSNAVQTPPPEKGTANRWYTTCNLVSAAPVTVLGSLLSPVCCLSLLSYLIPVDDGDGEFPNTAVDTGGHPAREAPIRPPKAGNPA